MDFGKLVEILKDHGLDIAEEAAKVLVEDVLNWVEQQVIASPNKYDDLVLAILPILKPKLLEAIDKIDGEVG